MRRFAFLLCALLMCAACSEPPQKEIDRAQGAIDAARAAGAEQYAPTEYRQAAEALQQAHDAVSQRDYRLALSRAVDANASAQAAAKEAADAKARARSAAEASISTIATSVQQLRTTLKAAEAARAPAAALAPARQTAASADAALQKARALLKQERYLEASDALKDVPAGISAQIRAVNEAAKARPARRRR
jgi:hypothetical protein